jgi:vacuolar-type H+-ATPase subunit I/STV1
MKLAVIIGVLHMTMGVIIKGTNDVYFKRWPGFIFDVCAGIIILEGLFGWMDLLIFAKWFFQPNFADATIIDSGVNATGSIDGTSPAVPTFQKIFKGDFINNRAPGVITVLINGVFGGGAPPEGTDTEFAYVGAGGYFNLTADGAETNYPSLAKQNSMYSTGIALLLCVIVCIPLMLFVKPCCCRGAPKKVGEASENNVIELSGHSGVSDQEQPLVAPNQKNSINDPGSRGESMNEG